MSKDDTLYLGHMLDTARKALELVRGKSGRTTTAMNRCAWPWRICCK